MSAQKFWVPERMEDVARDREPNITLKSRMQPPKNQVRYREKKIEKGQAVAQHLVDLFVGCGHRSVEVALYSTDQANCNSWEDLRTVLCLCGAG